jgi:dTMP kinase
MTSGRFITLEGGEGAGKSTQAGLLAALLARAGIDVEQTREPGGTPFAEALRGVLIGEAAQGVDPVAEALALFAARADHVARRIQPALAAGRWVICDRFSDSTFAYQCVAGGLARERFHAIQAAAIGGFAPDLTLVLDVPVALGMARARDPNRYERLGEVFHARVREGFLEAAAAAPTRCAVIDAGADLATVAARIAAVVTQRLGVAL